MIFDRVVVENFLSIGTASVPLDNRGLLLIQGENRENGGASSNGAGKSSLVDAIFWCLYGKTARGITTDDVVNDQAGKDCRVVVMIKDDTDNYVITRHRKHSTGKNRLTVHQNASEITKGTDKQTQELVNKIIGSTESVFASSVYAGQEAMPDLPMRTDKELKALVEEAAGIDRLNAAYQAQLKKANEIKREVERQEVEVEKATDRLSNVRNQLVRYEDTNNQWHVDQKLKAKRIKEEAQTFKGQYEKLGVTAIMSKKKSLEADLEGVRQRIAATDGERKQQETLKAAVSDAQSASKVAEAKARMAADDTRKKKAELEGVEKLVGTACRECGKDYAEHDLNDVRSLRKKALSTAAANYKAAKEQWEDALNRSRIAQETLADFERVMTNVSDELRAEREIRSSMVDVDNDVTRASQLKSQLENAVRRFKEAQAETSPYAKMIEDEKRRIVTIETEKADAEAKLETVKRRHLIAVKAAEVLSTSGVRAHILDHVTPLLNDRTAHYLGQLSEGEISATWQTISKTKAGDLREKFVIEVSNTKGAKSFGGLSGGEKRKVRIATAMALQDLVATRSAKALPLFIFDEIDHALDADGLERLMSIMKEKATKSGTVLVISHNDMNHYITETITVIKEHGISRVEV